MHHELDRLALGDLSGRVGRPRDEDVMARLEPGQGCAERRFCAGREFQFLSPLLCQPGMRDLSFASVGHVGWIERRRRFEARCTIKFARDARRESEATR